ncbi:MAG: hypothetical protein U9N45_03730, partial [Gemmatimonadota bacterium]|nr:hypothetical protein [Gemmatimonadota bacterium]
TAIKAVAMLSGGLDSILAVKLILDQGIDVVGVNYDTGFLLAEHRREMAGKGAGTKMGTDRNEAVRAGKVLGIRVEVIDVAEEYMEVIRNPEHGYGKSVNPCIDCRIFMLKKIKEYMKNVGAKFIITGEVSGQRPMSQMRNTMRHIEKESGCDGILLRPLSAKLLAPTVPEINGWVDRDRLCSIGGRGRKRQMELAEKYEIRKYPQPAGGGCFLTDPNFAVRLKDLIKSCGKEAVKRNQMEMLKVGRHFRISDRAKAIVGRNEAENIFLEKRTKGMTKIYCITRKGPLTVLEGECGVREIEIAAGITARYSSAKEKGSVTVKIEKEGGITEEIEINPMDNETCGKMRI